VGIGAGVPRISAIAIKMRKNAEPVGQLDPQSMAVQSIGVLIGRPLFIPGKLP
jgi:hypothetical protein